PALLLRRRPQAGAGAVPERGRVRRHVARVPQQRPARPRRLSGCRRLYPGRERSRIETIARTEAAVARVEGLSRRQFLRRGAGPAGLAGFALADPLSALAAKPSGTPKPIPG